VFWSLGRPARSASAWCRSSSPRAALTRFTDLPLGVDPACMAEALPRNARIRIEGSLIAEH
jgi:hypothetical protein